MAKPVITGNRQGLARVELRSPYGQLVVAHRGHVSFTIQNGARGWVDLLTNRGEVLFDDLARVGIKVTVPIHWQREVT